jgi:hypothetical protein
VLLQISVRLGRAAALLLVRPEVDEQKLEQLGHDAKKLIVELIIELVVELLIGGALERLDDIIDRFSEDIDIVLDSEIFGFKYIDKPSKTYVEQLRREGCKFTSNEIASELRSQLAKVEIPNDLYSIEVEAIRENMPDTDPQVIYLNYKLLL